MSSGRARAVTCSLLSRAASTRHGSGTGQLNSRCVCGAWRGATTLPSALSLTHKWTASDREDRAFSITLPSTRLNSLQVFPKGESGSKDSKGNSSRFERTSSTDSKPDEQPQRRPSAPVWRIVEGRRSSEDKGRRSADFALGDGASRSDRTSRWTGGVSLSRRKSKDRMSEGAVPRKPKLFADAGDPEFVCSYTSGGSFGELALMFNFPRAATIRCTKGGMLWAIGRKAFRGMCVRGNRELNQRALPRIAVLH
eukprot:5396946-Prymnesium_polylepis.1